MKCSNYCRRISLNSIICADFALCFHSQAAMEVTSEPIGYVSRSAPASKLTLLSTTFFKPAVFRGELTSVQSDVVEVSGASWTTDAYNDTYYIEVVSSGAMADIIDTDTSSLILADDISSMASIGDTILIRPHVTVVDVFGASNDFGLTAGTGLTTADSVVIFNNQTKSSETIFYYDGSGPGDAGWYNSSFESAADTIIYPEQGIYISRLSGSELDVTLSGEVKSNIMCTPVFNGLNILGIVSTGNVKLSDLNLVTESDSTGLKSGAGSVEADTLTILEDGSSQVYFYHDGSLGAEGWYNPSYEPADDVTIPAGASILIERGESLAAFNWIQPSQ